MVATCVHARLLKSRRHVSEFSGMPPKMNTLFVTGSKLAAKPAREDGAFVVVTGCHCNETPSDNSAASKATCVSIGFQRLKW